MKGIKGMKRVVALSLFTLVLFGAKPDDKPKKGWIWQRNTNNNNYTLSEEQARNKMQSDIGKKFGKKICSLFIFFWPFRSQESTDNIKLKNKELQEIKNIAEKEIKSPDNYRSVLCREAFIKYVTKIIKKPEKKVSVEWKHEKKQIPVREFKDVKRKRYDEHKLKNSTYDKVIELISEKSYTYALKKTKSPVVADIVKKKIAKELQDKIHNKQTSLSNYIGKKREKKIDGIIDALSKKENLKCNIVKKENLKEATKAKFTTYPTRQCNVCKKSFKQVERIFLYPCGHDICKSCFATYNKKCPICRQNIEKGVTQ